MKFDAKTVLAIAKKRWPVIVSGLVIVVSIPTALYFSGSMRSTLVAQVQKSVEGDVKGLAEVKTVAYTVPATPGTPAVELSAAPNQKLIEVFKARREQQGADLAQVISAADEFNSTHALVEGRQVKRVKRAPLIEGLFPSPKDNDRLTRSNFQRAYIERAHKELLTRYRAGGPPEAPAFARAVEEYKVQQIALVAGEGKTEQALSDAERERVRDAVVKYRIGRQKQRAAELAFYCDLNAFSIPAASDDPPETYILWDWQQTYWLREDILAAAAIANSSASDIGVSDAVVKRIESVAVEPLFDLKTAGQFGSPDPAAAPAAASAEGAVPVDFRYGITGRVAGAGSGNSFYDIRKATVVAIVATQQIPAFIDALAQTNFLSVLDIDLAKVDTHLEQQAGYYYGGEPVSRVTMVVESIWLRDWLTPSMPAAVRAHFGVPDPAPVEGAPGEAATEAGREITPVAPAPAAPPARRPGGGG